MPYDKIDQLYDALKADGAVSKDREYFRGQMLAPGEQGYKNRKQLYDALKADGAVESPTYEDFAAGLGLHAGKPERVTAQSYQPTQEEMAGFQQTIRSAGGAAQNPTQGYDRKAQLMKKRQGLNVPQRVNLGESNNLTPTEQRFNPETGELEQGYMTEAGNEYESRAIADMEQRQIEQAKRDEQYRQSLPGQLDDAYAERDRLNEELAKYQGQWVDQDGRVHYGNRGDDESVASLEAALRQNQERITALEAERDDDGGTQFWRGFIDAAKNPSVQSFGLTDFNDTMQLMRIKSKIDAAKESGVEPQLSPAEQQLMESTYLNDYAQSAYGENRGFMYRAGGISMQALPFVAEFMATGGMGALSQKGAELGTKAAEKLALTGLKKALVKNLGIVAGDVAAGWAMANTTGLFRTAGDVMQRNIGQVAIDDDGNLGFEGGKSLGRSIYEAEVANTLEYYTEKLGEHLQLGKWIAKGADKMGLKKLSKAVNYLSGSKWLERGGIQDYPSEVVEEEANLLLNGILVGDNNFSMDPNSKDWNQSAFNPKTQLDIWGGMLFSIGLMQAPRLAGTAYNAAGYYAFKKNVDMSDSDAAIVFGRDNWEMIKEQIDNCDNDQLPELLETVVNGKMTDVEKTATMNYAGNLMKMRGYNMGMMADTKEESSNPNAPISQSINQSYMAGHQTEDPDDMKMFVDEVQAAAQDLSQYGEEFQKLVTEDTDPVRVLDYMMNNRDTYSDEEIAAAADYYQKHARAQGVMDAAMDRVDLEVEKANAEVRSNTHQQTGNVITAQSGDNTYYIIGGDVATNEETGMPVVAGTGGAVVVKDALTGEVSVKSPQDVMITSMQSADDLFRYNDEVLRQQLEQQADDDITYGSPANEVYDMEDQVTLQDGDGETIDGTVVMLPNAVDGVFVVETSDGKALQMTADELNRRIVMHNGMEVQRRSAQEIPLENPQNHPEATPFTPFTPQNAQNPQNYAQNQPQNIPEVSGNTPRVNENTPKETEITPEEKPQSALDRIPIRTDSQGQPVKGKNGRPILDWHKASVEDAAAALIETTGGDMVMARDTASDLVRNEQTRLDKIRKQKPKGDDPIEIAESRVAIRKQEQEQQTIIKQWQDVNQYIQKQMRDEAAARQAEIEAAKSAEQKAREAEEARIRKEKQDEQDRQRLREQIEKDKVKRNREYEPLVKAREELADDLEALEILNDTEPRDLEEWVSSLLRPHSMLWQDASNAEVGLQSELGLKRADMQRMMSLLGTKESGAKPFGKVVLDIYEGLSDAMKEQYTDEDVRRTLLNLFNEGSSARMLNLTQEHRIEEARQTAKENARRDAEAEMDAWAEAYHLTPEEREQFEAYLEMPPTEPETEIINQIISEHESYRTSPSVGEQPDRGTVQPGFGTGQGEIQGSDVTAGNGNPTVEAPATFEISTGQPSDADNDVAGGTQGPAIASSEQLKPTDLRDAVRPESAELGVNEANAKAQLQAKAKGWLTDENVEWAEGRDLDEIIEKFGNEPEPIAVLPAIVRQNVPSLTDDYLYCGKAYFIDHHANHHPELDIDEYDNIQTILDSYDDIKDLSEDGNLKIAFVKKLDKGYAVVVELSKENDKIMLHKTFFYKDAAGKRIPFKNKPSIKEKWSVDGSTTISPAVSRQQPADTENISALDQSSEGKGTNNFSNNQENLGKTSSPKEIAAEEAKVDTNPTEGQKEAGNYQKGHINVDGYDITIENPKGSVRSGVDSKGNRWETTMHNTYGYIRGTEGVDGDHIDVFLSDNPTSGSVFVVDQVNPDTGAFDEHKVMYGFASEEEAREAYLANYDEGWQGLGAITEVSREEFKKWVESSHRKTKPFHNYKRVNTAETEILAKGGTIYKNNIAGGDAVVKIVGSNIDKKTGARKYLVEYYPDEQAVKERIAIGDGYVSQNEMRELLSNGSFAPRKAAETMQKTQQAKPEKQHKRLVSDDKMEELRKRLLEKMNNLNEGLDMERMLIGAAYAVGKIERGVTKFADFCADMIEDLGDAIRPYLKLFYNGARDLPEAAELRPLMDDAQTVDAFDVYNFDKKKQPTAIEKAEQVVQERKVRQQAKKIKAEQPDLYAGDLFGAQQEPLTEKQEPSTAQKEPLNQAESGTTLRPATEADLDSFNPTVYYEGKPAHIISIMRKGEQTSATTFSKPTISSILLTNGKWVKLEDLMVKDESENQKPVKSQLNKKSDWWSDPNRPESIDPKDYKTYMTDEAKNYFANFVSEDGKTDFTKWAHPNLAYITAAIWDEVEIPYEDLKDIPEIVEAENTIKKAEAKGKLEISDEEADKLAQRLVDQSQARHERKALVIIGLPAGGKSSVFANPLAKEYGARIIDSDDVKPWLDGFDGGNGAGYVHDASAEVAERAIDISARNGDNIIIPRIGGKSVMDLSAALRLAGYDVQLYFNDVKGVTSIDRAASRFAETGRYLSLDYLTKKAGVPSENFSKFAEKSIGGFLDERDQKEVQDIRGRLQRLRGKLDVSGEGLWEPSSTEQGGYRTAEESLQADLGGGEQQAGGNGVSLLLAEPLFNYAEWKSNDVKRGEKPKEIWNSKSGKPMPGKENKSNNNNDELHSVRSGQGVSAESSPVGEGAEQAGGPADRAGAERSPEQDRAERSGRERSVEKPKPKHNNRRNNVGERGKDYAPTSPKARFNANVEAIKLMRVLMDEGIDAPTQDQMEVLRQYSGWGGLGTFFNDDRLAENRILRDLLTEEEYNDAAMSINSAYYTPATVIDTLWDIAEAMGFDGGNVLEGSAGIGNIIGQMPKKLSSRSDIEAVEIDKISGNILKLLYPDAKVHIAGFQDVKIPNGSVDLAITNVPFATGIPVFDETDKDLSRKFRSLHDFCIAKNIRKLREGGVGIFITTSGTMDKSTDLRSWITDDGQADIVGAFRLNNETFGGAKVTSDIIVVRKRVNGEKSEHAIDVKQASPIRIGSYTDKFDKEHQTSMTVNDYFHDHPEMMAGEMFFGYEKGNTFRPGSYGLYPVEGKDQEKMMKGFVKAMAKAKQTTPKSSAEEQKPEPNQLTAVKEGRMLIDDNGRLCVSRYGTAVPLGLNDQKVKGFTKKQCFEDYQAVQKAVDDVLQQQLNDPDDVHLEPKLKTLNAEYDKFVKRYGTLHKNTAISFLRNDIDFPSFQALENYSETKDMSGKVKVTTKKTPVFTQRVLGFKTEPQPKTVKDAVIASIFRSNGIDLEWIANKLSEVAAPPNGDNWTVDDVRKGILVSRLGFEDPSTGQIEIRYKYLSGNVREKLAMAEAYNTDGKYSANVEELRKVIPMDIPAHLIDFSLGSSWIPVELYKQYLEENYDLSNIRLNHVEGNWVLDEGYSYRNEKNRAAGIYSEKFRETIYGHQLVAAALNNRPYKVSKQVSEGWGSNKTTKTVVDKDATQACAVRVDEIKDEFKQWAKKKMQDDPELGARIEKIYNEKFNALVPMEIDDEFLPDHFEDSNTNITLRPHQKRGVIRDLSAPTMLAHEVGTGKSFTLITTAMEMRRLGTARKPMLVVQNATVAQMTSDVKLLYPNAKVLSLTEKDRDAEGRRAFYAKIRYNDWDLIIIPQSTFERIPDSPERELQFIQEKIDEKKHVIEAAMQSGMDSREIQRLKKELDKLEDEYGDKYLDSDPANASTPKKSKKKDAKKEAAALDKAKTKAQEQLDRAVDDVQYFDDLGVDALLIDEAHEYKHLGFQTSIGRGIKGIDPSYSKKCAGLYNKTRSVFEKAGWKNVVFATGTPISNTAAEIWTFMKYLMPADVMRANDIYYFDDFVHNFGAISQMLEFSTSGKFKENTRFAAYVNKPELIRIWSQVADTVLTKDAEGVKDKLPQKEGGKDQDVFLPQSPSLISIMAAVRAELERFENMTGQEKKENSSIPLTMYGIAKRAAIDPRLVNPDAADEPMSKTNAAVKEIVKDLKETAKYKGTVAVFCDNQNRKGPDGSVEFNIYEDMKKKLIEAGVPENQIAIIKSGMSITAKQKVFDAVNDGSIRVVLGSTQTLGTGVNMQERLHLLIHMDAPDRPMDYTQRNGRIERQGNLHKDWDKPIRIVRFGVEDSLDVTAYQRLKTKSGFINSIMDGKAALANNQVDRTVEEEEEGLFDNPVAVLSGSQYALKKNQAERELRKYQGKKAQWEADQVYVTNQLRRNKSEVEATEANIKTEEEQLAHIRKLFPDGKVKTITVEGVPIDMTKDDGEKKLNEAIKEKINDPVNAIVKRNRENAIYNDETLHYTIKLDGHDVNFTVQVMRESVYEQGRMRTVIHKYTSYSSPDLRIDSNTSSTSVREHLETILDEVVTGQDYEDRIDAYKAKIERINAETEQIQQRVGMEFQFDKELEQARKNVEEYTELMKKEMEEKEAKYAAQQKEAKENGGFDLSKAEDSEDDDDVRYSADEDWEEERTMLRGSDEFAEGQQFPIRRVAADSSYNVLGRSYQYSSDLLPDEFATPQALLDAVRNAYPNYYAAIEADAIVLRGWDTVMAEARNARTVKDVKGTESYVERKTRQAIDAVTDMANRMHLDVEVLTTTEGLQGKKARSKGWFNPKTHKIVIVLPNHTNKDDVIGTLLHEGVAHYGLRKMFGQNFDTFLDNVYNNVSPEIKARIDAAMKRNGWSRHEATEEYLARLAEHTDFEHTTTNGWWQKIKDFFLEMLSKAGFNTTLTDNELRYILWRSYDHLLHPDGRRNVFDTAKEIQMQSRLQVGDYAEQIPVRRTATGEAAPVAAEQVNEELLNSDIQDIPSQELLLTLQEKGEDERNEAVNELIRRVREGEARIIRMGQEVQLDRESDAQIAGAILGGWQLGLSAQSDGTLRGVVQGGSQMVSRSSAQGQDTSTDSELPIISWAKATGHYYDEEQVKKQSLDKDYWHSGAESRVYRTADGKKVIKFMETWVYYQNPLLKRIDDISLQNAAGFEHLNVLGYSLDEKGNLLTVAEQDLVDGVTVDEMFDDDGIDRINGYIDRYLQRVVGLSPHWDENGNIYYMKDGIQYRDIHGANVIVDKNGKPHIIDALVERAIDSGKERAEGFSIEDEEKELYSIRTKEPPKKTGKGYKVFVLKDGQLYPPMVANPNGEGTPIGVWLDADAAPVAGTSKTGRPQVKAGGKGTQGGSGQLAYRPGWHLGTIPYALQFGRKDENGERTLFPNNFVWAEVEYADDVDYQDEAHKEGVNENGKFQHSLAGLKRVPVDGSYKYRTNPDPKTDEWVITGAMRVNKILSREEVDELVKKAGREPQRIQDGDILTQDIVDELNAEIKATKEADEMGLLYRDDDSWTDDVAQEFYEKAVAQEGIKVKEAWQDSMVALKLIQNAIARETGRVATGAEDAYRFENRMHGRAKNMTEQYDWKYYRPMLKAFNDFCKANDLPHEMGMEYLISKSGLERNIYFALRDGAKAKIVDDVKKEREQLEKDYAKGRISEADYRTKLSDLNNKEQNGFEDLIKDITDSYAYQHAKEEYDAGNISYTEYLRIKETIIRDALKRKTPKKDADGHVVSDNYYDDYARDYSGLTETFAKEMYDNAQTIKKEAQRAIDPQEKRGLWAQYDEAMRQAYQTARQIAEDAVFVSEENREPADKLWEKINDATKETLRQSYESGLMDRNTYNKVRAMFDYYIPLRGWEEDKASDVYTYMGRDNVFSPAVKKAWGRTSKAENPLAYVGNIAVSTILAGHRNQMKQHFLNYVMNNPTSLVSISESWYENIAPEGESPVWILRTADTAGKSPDEIATIVNDFNDEMQQKQREGKAMPVKGRLRLDVHATSGQKSEHVVEVQRAGHTYQLYINGNPKAAQALNGSAARAVSRISDTWLGKKITKINRDMAMFFTSKNPAFVVSNLSRDLNMAGASVRVNENNAYNKKFIKNVAKVLAPRMGESSKWVPASKQPTGLMPSLMRKWKNGTLDLSNETERYFGEFMDEGGETGFVNMLSIDSFKEKMKKEIAEMNGSALFGKGVKETSVHKGLRLLGETFEFYNRCAEDATRFIVYMTSRQMGKTLEESIADAKDVTLNFNRKGTGGLGNAEVRDLFIFVNPAIQALANMYRMAKGHPLKFGAVTAAFVAGGALMPIINQWLLNMFGDDDDKQAYWNLPPWVRKNNLVFWLPFTKNFLTIPLAQEFRVFYGVGEMMSSAIMDHPMDKWGLEVFSSVSDLIPINPTGNGGNLMVDFAPTMVQPLMQVGENVDFTGKPIWRENQGNKYAPMYEKAYVTTPQWMIKMSEKVNDLTGGNEGKKGVVEKYAPFWGDYINNPAVWNHLLQGYFGGMYNTIAKTFDVGVTAAKGELPKIYQTPVINRFLNRPVERDNAGALGEEYYNLTEERDAIQYELRTWQKKAADGEEGAQEHVDEILESPEYKRAEVISHYEKIMRDLKAGEKAATESADKADIKESISLFKQQMMEELNAIENGKDPLDAAIEAFGNAKTFSEKNRLRMRIERLMMRQNGAAKPKTKGRAAEVEKALSYISDEEKESRDTNEKYLSLASANDVRDDARIKAAKAKVKAVNDEYKLLMADSPERAAQFYRQHEKELTAYRIIDQQGRLMNQNKKLLGKGSDQNIMHLIANNRKAMLNAIDKIR